MLELAEYGLMAAGVLVALALVCNVVVVSGRRRALVTTGGPEPAAPPVEKGRARSHGLAAYGTGLLWLAIIVITLAMVARMTVTGHGPFSNQHEFAVSFAWGMLVAYLIFEYRFRVRMLSLVVLPLSAGMLLYALNLDTSPSPLMPALQNSWLLTLHVAFAMVAYGAAAVAFGAAVLYLLRPRLTRLPMPRAELLDEIGYRAGVLTFPLLTVMLVLGALWADIAWGRYWGWDPKETAALVTWLIYGAYLHARVVRDWRGRRAAWLLVVGFAAVLFTYFGNHFFGGLHSYV